MDITMCLNKKCKKRLKCLRFTAKPDPLETYAEFDGRGCFYVRNDCHNCGNRRTLGEHFYCTIGTKGICYEHIIGVDNCKGWRDSK